MKKIMVLLIVALFTLPFLLCVTKAQAAADWRQYFQSEVATFWYDANSVQRSGNVVKVTVFIKFTPAVAQIFPGIDIVSEVMFAEINCRTKTFFQKRIIQYRADGSVYDDFSSEDNDPYSPTYEPYDIKPGYEEDALYRILCGC